MKKILLIICCALSAYTTIQAQTIPVKKRAVGISLGWQNFTFLDKHASPLAYGTNSIFPKVGLSYSRQTNRSQFEIEVSGATGQVSPKKFGARKYKTMKSPTDSFQYSISSQFLNANIKAGYFRNISSLSTDKVNYWAGGIVSESAYYGDGVANMPWLLNAADLSPAFRVDYTPAASHNIGIRFDFAALGIITRATYGLFAKSNKDKNVPAYFKQGTRVAAPDKYRKANLQLLYQYQVSRHVAAGMAFSMKWMDISFPKPVHAIDKNVDIKFSYTY